MESVSPKVVCIECGKNFRRYDLPGRAVGAPRDAEATRQWLRQHRLPVAAQVSALRARSLAAAVAAFGLPQASDGVAANDCSAWRTGIALLPRAMR